MTAEPDDEPEVELPPGVLARCSVTWAPGELEVTPRWMAERAAKETPPEGALESEP